MGSTINVATSRFGDSVDINGAGDVIVAGGYYYNSGTQGIVKVYEWSGSAWSQKGSSIIGSAGEYVGWHVATDSTGDLSLIHI